MTKPICLADTLTRPRYTVQTGSNAALLREYAAWTVGYFFEFGASIDTAQRARRMAKRIAKMTGVTFEAACEEIRVRYLQLFSEF